jgi:filamentous hemagglutinin family protein
MRPRRLSLNQGLRFLLAGVGGALASPAFAQITVDGTLSAGRSLDGPNFAITADLGRQAGANLFHSFGQFNLHFNPLTLVRESATFSGPSSIVNIISRVTGGQASAIDGTIRSTIPGANLYLINPSGLMFGPHATLDVSGSFHASTADHIRFTDGAIFGATNPSGSTLTVAAPEAFGFTASNPAALTVDHSTLSVPPGSGLSLAGGNLQISGGTIAAPAGRIHIVGVAGPGEVGLDPADESRITAPLGPVAIVGGSLVDVSNRSVGSLVPGGAFIRGGALVIDGSTVTAANFGADTGGLLFLRGNDSLALSNGGSITTATFGSGRAGNLFVSGNAITIDGGSTSGFASISADAAARSTGGAGTIAVNAQALTLRRGGSISAVSSGPGTAGTVGITADSLLIDGSSTVGGGDTSITANALGPSTGGAGTVTVTVAGTMSVVNGGSISSDTLGSGRAGNVIASANAITIDGGSSVGFAFISADAVGAQSSSAGSVTINAGTLSLGKGASISTNLFGAATSSNAGSVVIKAETLTVGRGGSISANSSGATTSSNAGSVVIEAETLTVGRGGFIEADSSGPGRPGNILISGTAITIGGSGSGGPAVISADANADSAAAGSVTVKAGTLTFQVGVIETDSFGSGNAGTVTVSANTILMDGLKISNFSTGIDSVSGDIGNAGRITVDAGSIIMRAGGEISTATQFSGTGGSVVVMAKSLLVDGSNTRIGSDASILSTGKAGTVTVVVDGALSIVNGGNISSDTRGNGDAGAVAVTANTILIDNANLGGTGISSRAVKSTGNGGRVTVDAGSITLRGGGQISTGTSTAGNAGDVAVTADSLLIDGSGSTRITSSAFNNSTGNAGTVTVKVTGPISIVNGSNISSDTFGRGRGGDVFVSANAITIDGGSNGGLAFISAGANGAASSGAGSVTVKAQTLLTVRSRGSISSDTFGSGDAGDVVVTADSLLIEGNNVDGFTRIASSALNTSTGNAGKVTVDVAGTMSIVDGGNISSETFGPGRAGNVFVSAKAITIARGLISTGSFDAVATGDAGDVMLKAGSLSIDGTGSPFFTGVSSVAARQSTGRAGNIDVDVSGGKVTIAGGGQIASSTDGSGDAGKVTVQAATIALSAGGSISTTSFGRGRAGSVTVSANAITIDGGAGISSGSLGAQSGDAGKVTVQAETMALSDNGLISTNTSGGGRAGIIDVDVFGKLTLTGGGEIASRTASSGDAGSVRVHAGEIVIDGPPGTFTAIDSRAEAGSTGNAGRVEVTAQDISLLDGGLIASDTSGIGNGGLVTISAGRVLVGNLSEISSAANEPNSGTAGTVTVDATSIELRDGGRISSSASGSGAGGDVTLRATGSIVVAGVGSSIAALSSTGSNAGNIFLATTDLVLSGGGNVTTAAVQGGGGRIVIEANHLLRLKDGQIVTSVASGVGNGGDITIDPQFVVLDHGLIQANALGGNGGNITIVAGQFLASPDSIVQASSQLGISGAIAIQAPTNDITGTLTELAGKFGNELALANAGCATAARAEKSSSLTAVGRGGLPDSGDGPQLGHYFGGRETATAAKGGERLLVASGGAASKCW